MDQLKATYCRSHKNRTTKLSCGRCNEPVCSSCIGESPVGIRCKNCLNQYTPKIYRVGSSLVIKTMLVSSAVILSLGMIYTLVIFYIGPFLQLGILFNVLNFAFLTFSGLVVGKSLNLTLQNKVFRWSTQFAIVSVIGAFVVGNLLNLLFFGVVPTFLLAYSFYGWAVTLVGLVLGISIAMRIAR